MLLSKSFVEFGNSAGSGFFVPGGACSKYLMWKHNQMYANKGRVTLFPSSVTNQISYKLMIISK